MPELISKSEYARRRGCDPAAVTRAIQKQWITLIDGKIDPVVADVQWAAAARPRADSRPATAKGAELAGISVTARPRAVRPVMLDDGPPPMGYESSGVPDYQVSRAKREAAEAELAELKLAEERSQLIRVDEVRSAYAKKAAGLREAMMQIPARLSAVLAAETDAGKVHAAIEAEIRGVLLQLTDSSEQGEGVSP